MKRSTRKHASMPSALSGKLASVAGDTLAEVLIALLIVVLATTLLATMVVTSTKATSQSEAAMSGAYAAQSNLASKGGAQGNIDVSITSSDGKLGTSTSDSVVWKVPLYESDGFACYEAAEF